jgi:hypothetical protein
MADEQKGAAGNSNSMLLKKFFGYREGQTFKDFAEELKQLTPEEREEMANLIRQSGQA